MKFDVATDDMGCEYRAVSSTGVAVGFNGPGRTFDITGKATDITDMGLLEDITPDGKMISGSIIGELGYDTHACIWKDGEPAMLASLRTHGWDLRPTAPPQSTSAETEA